MVNFVWKMKEFTVKLQWNKTIPCDDWIPFIFEPYTIYKLCTKLRIQNFGYTIILRVILTPIMVMVAFVSKSEFFNSMTVDGQGEKRESSLTCEMNFHRTALPIILQFCFCQVQFLSFNGTFIKSYLHSTFCSSCLCLFFGFDLSPLSLKIPPWLALSPL